ncbi:hypothetical protein HYZ06_00980 [Candidatus Daviesbacteria bacterium]|nr:hypothetical protein [Candidatus Daviesbacteria bacterium]
MTLDFRIQNLEFRIKIFLSFILTALFLLLVPTAFAQTLPSSGQASTYNLPTTVSPTSPIYTDLLVHNLFHTFSCLSVGSSVIGQPCLSYQVTKDAQGAIQSVPVLSRVNLGGGALGATTSLIGVLYANPPVRTVDYLASVGQGLGIIKEAKAQVIGSGAQVLNPILTLWQVSRNISYVFMIIIFVVIGLMVMFRNRINPQTVITAQAALPGLVIGLILITFSYFLASLISDTAFIGTNIVGAYFSTVRGTPQNLVQDLDSPDPNTGRKPNLISIFSKFATVANKEKVTEVLNSFWDDIHNDAQRLLVTLAALVSAQITGQAFEWLKLIPKFGEGIIAALQGLAVLNTATGPIGPTAIVGALFALVVTAILLYAMFKLLMRLINVYLTIIFLTITAPFQFLAAALPGRQGIATSWILNMLANILAFPAVIAVFYFVAFMLGSANGPYGPFKVSDSGGATVSNGLVSTVGAQGPVEITGTFTFPLFGGMGLDFIKLLLAFGALVATPAIPDILARTIGRVGVAGQLIGQEISGGIAAGRGYGQQAQQGVGAASGNLARARGLFGTPAYMPTGFDPKTGQPTGWTYNPLQYQPSIREKFKIYSDASSGKIKPYKQGG